ncbi:MAG: hypothetical protein AB7I30_10525 [Isosphaeraceae bacterium]
MTLPELLACTEALGIRLEVRLRVDATEGAITPAIRQALVTFRTPLLRHLARETEWEELRVQRWGGAGPEPGIESAGPCRDLGRLAEIISDRS